MPGVAVRRSSALLHASRVEKSGVRAEAGRRRNRAPSPAPGSARRARPRRGVALVPGGGSCRCPGIFLPGCSCRRPAQGSHGSPLRGLRGAQGGAWPEGGAGSGSLFLCMWLAAAGPLSSSTPRSPRLCLLSARCCSHGVGRESLGCILRAQRQLRRPQGAVQRKPGDRCARRAVGRRRQGKGGGSAGAGRRHRVPLPGEATGL